MGAAFQLRLQTRGLDQTTIQRHFGAVGTGLLDADATFRAPDALACLRDGAGAQQSVALMLDRGASKAAAFLLLKAGHGVKDTFIAPVEGTGEQRRMLEELEAMGAVELDLDFMARMLERALGFGAAHGRPSAPGLVDVADV